jgi:PadR family transcriptional regulator PadR
MEPPLTAKAALLQALVQGEGFGLELIERVKERTNGEIVLHQGSVYPALRSLEREGLVESYEGESLPERGGRPRRYYQLTAEGARVAIGQKTIILGLLSAGAVP